MNDDSYRCRFLTSQLLVRLNAETTCRLLKLRGRRPRHCARYRTAAEIFAVCQDGLWKGCMSGIPHWHRLIRRSLRLVQRRLNEAAELSERDDDSDLDSEFQRPTPTRPATFRSAEQNPPSSPPQI